MHPLMPGLEDGAIVRLMPSSRRIMNMRGQFVQRPEIGVRLHYTREPDLTLRSGKIAIGDPMSAADSILAISVAPGVYQAWSLLAKTANETRVAAAIILLSDAPATSRTVAAFEGEDPADIDLDTIGGVDVDSGTICICDPPADASAVEEFLSRARKDAATDSHHRHLSDPTLGDFGLWATGMGDGMYTPYLGLAADKRPCYFAVDFGIIANALRGPVVPWATMGDSFALVPEPHRPWHRRLLARLGLA